MYSLVRATSSRPVGLWSLVGLVLVPLVVAAGFLWATWDSTDRLDRVQAAVVNLDEPVELDGRTVPLGRQLAGGLVTGRSGEQQVDANFDWVLTDQADATAGLESGAYAAVVTIPETFSARATSFSKADPSKIRPATLDVRTSEASGIADPVIGQAITAAATSALNTTLTREYLDGIYVGFNDLGKQFRTVADASDKLADGTEQLSTGIDGVSTGTTGLAEGLQQLDDGAQQLATGSAGLTKGTAGLAAGLQELSDGASALPAGARELARGSERAADGADRLAAGSQGVATGLARYSQELRRQAASTGNSVEAPFRPATTSPTARQPQLPPCPTTKPALTPEQCQVVLATLAAVVGQVEAEATRQATQQVKAAAAYAGAQGAARALRGAADGLSAKDPKTGQSLLSGSQSLASGQAQAADGLQELAEGTDQFAQGLVPLTRGIASSADGADELATGVREFGTGVSGLAAGTAQSASGADELATGAARLGDAGEQLADGNRELADGLARGADAVPTYDEQTRKRLSDVASQPVQTPAPTSVFSNVTTTTFLAVLALWVGALASFLVLRPYPARVLASMKPSWRLALEGLLPALGIGLLQAVALSVMLALLLDLPAGRTLQLGALLGLTAAAFVALNHALVAWFGGVGRFVSVVVLVAGAAGAVTAAVPASFDVLRPFLPLTPALDGLRAVVTEGSGAGSAVGLLLAWLLVGLVAGVLAVTRRRMVAPLVVAPVV